MAAIDTSSNKQSKGVDYTWTTAVIGDETSVPVSTYFYNLEDKLPYYKNGDGLVLTLFSEGGGDSIYTADGEITEDRNIDIGEHDLTFNNSELITFKSPEYSGSNFTQSLKIKTTDWGAITPFLQSGRNVAVWNDGDVITQEQSMLLGHEQIKANLEELGYTVEIVGI
jgi:hypothetical protein